MPGIGVRIKAIVDGAIRSNPELAHLYSQIKKGTLTSLSFGGFFRRLGRKIIDLDITELSITGTPVHKATTFSVVEGKALEMALILHKRENLIWLRDQLQQREDAKSLRDSVELLTLSDRLNRMTKLRGLEHKLNLAAARIAVAEINASV